MVLALVRSLKNLALVFDIHAERIRPRRHATNKAFEAALKVALPTAAREEMQHVGNVPDTGPRGADGASTWALAGGAAGGETGGVPLAIRPRGPSSRAAGPWA